MLRKTHIFLLIIPKC